MMGETVAHNIMGQKVKYEPGTWFNSAKFLDIEYQVYGEVPGQIPDDMVSLYWEHDDGDKSIRINYGKENNIIRGFNLMGIRYRHEVCEKWIKEKTNVETVLENLSLANFDPEFYQEYEIELISLYNVKTGADLKKKKSRKLDQVLSFLNPLKSKA